MSWKDYFYFTRSERSGIIVFICIMLIILSYPHFYEYFYQEPPIPDFTGLSHQIDQYEQMAHNATMRTTEAKAGNTPSFSSLRPFNPNLITPEECEQMGLPPKMVSNLVNYRNAGGKFQYREDMLKLYQMNDELYASLSDYIILPTKSSQVADTISALKTSARRVHNMDATPGTFNNILRINTADTLQWQQLKGIGRVFSKRIVSYRNLLGGFYSVEQLREVYGLDSVTFNEINEHLILDTIELNQINVNTADFKTLLRHPYLSYNQVTSIINLRQTHGPFQSIEAIKASHLISEDDFTRIAPYLRVED